ncbi:hypothetical protein [Paenibacillus woosongensis]|uniref:Phosphoglycerate mutase n=1 Tax=Paenibacillus woosongensis TaxID=307580 RepID=A0ABQ4MLA0_9BACL|nr:hypothetical protein [Paenibacillus woosongensis]GIP56761.1 hypothetical protein J15TS10_05750 [Paenibacillus woosongensis]
MKELVLIHISPGRDSATLGEIENRITEICDKIKLDRSPAQMSLYSTSEKEAVKALSLSVSNKLQLAIMGDWKAEFSLSDAADSSSIFKSVNRVMNQLDQRESGSVIMVTSNDLLSCFIGWWLRLPQEKWIEWEFILEPLGFHVLNINKSGDRSLYKYNEG